MKKLYAILFIFVIMLCFTCPAMAQVLNDTSSLAIESGLEYDEYADEYDAYPSAVTIADPLKGFNMMMYDFNEGLYYFAIKPVSQAFRTVVPVEIRTATRNFFRNLAFPVRFINCLLQAKWDRAVDEFSAFFLNTTIGVLGLGDVAPHIMDREIPKEDFGQTLATWGVDNGFYIVLPILGPSTARNTVGLIGDVFMDPVTYMGINWEIELIARTTELVNYFSFQKDVYKQLKEVSLDPYIALRNGYIQNDDKNIAE